MTVFSNDLRALTLLALTLVFLTGCASSQQKSKNAQIADINVRLGISYLQQGQLNLAHTKLKRALKHEPNSSLVQWSNALLHERMGELDKAEVYYKKAIRLDQNDSEALNNYGAFLCKQSRVDEALKAFESAVKNPLYATRDFAYTNAGICLQENDRQDEAKDYFLKALDIRPNSTLANYQMALLYYRQGRYPQSKLFRSHIEGEAALSAKVLWLCAVTERNLGNRNTAGNCSKKLLQRHPASREADQLNLRQ